MKEKASAIETLGSKKIELMEKATEVTNPQEKTSLSISCFCNRSKRVISMEKKH
jgi:hypothetical protein